MHAVVIQVNIKNPNPKEAEEELRKNVVPVVAQSPGFVAGYWTRSENKGMAMVVFESEDAARQMAERVPQTVPEDVELQDVEVREVVANA